MKLRLLWSLGCSVLLGCGAGSEAAPPRPAVEVSLPATSSDAARASTDQPDDAQIDQPDGESVAVAGAFGSLVPIGSAGATNGEAPGDVTGFGRVGGSAGAIGHGSGCPDGGEGCLRGRGVAPPAEGASIDREVIRAGVRAGLASIKACYEQRLAGNPGLRGRAVMRFVIAPSGAVAKASVAESTLNDPELERCLERAVTKLQFPPQTGGPAIVNYPFVFEPGN